MKREDSSVVCRYFQSFLIVIILCAASAILTNAQITYSFSNPNPIAINDSSPANPYPSTINVTNVTSVISKVTVSINNLTHTFPGDIDVMLVSPNGQNVVIMSDVGSGDNVNNINLTLDDAAPTAMPGNLLTGGTYRPTNLTAGDIFPAPAPSPVGGSVLSVFNGINANGIWRLYVVDDAGVDTGSIAGGWSLTITNAISGENTTAISIPNAGTASPYPSAISITDHINPVANFQVNLTNFSHSSPDDVDLMLVSPSGRKIVLMSDVGGANPINNVNLTFDDTGSGFLPDDAQIVSGVYKPTNFEPGDDFPAPAPAGAPTGTKLSALNGDVANGAWQLFLVDDNGNNSGNISGGWSIAIQTLDNVIAIPAFGTAQPYSADKLITGLPGNVTKAVVTLTNFSHTSPDDVDIMLVAPNGRRIVLMSDVGGSTEVGSLNLIFDDAAVSNLPDNSALVSGTYKPTDFEPGEVFPAPAPTGAVTGTTLNAFYGTAPNGVWKLFVVDDNGENLGSIAGSWNITLQSSTSACVFTVSPTIQTFPITGGSGSFAINMPVGCSWSASASASFVTISSGTTGDGSGTLSFTVDANMGGGRAGSIDVTNGVLVRTFQVQQPSGCPFALSQSVVNFSASGGSGSVGVTAGSVCGWQAASGVSWIQITSGAQTGDGTANFTVQPNPGANPRSATVTVGARTFTVNQSANSTGQKFDFDGDGKADVSVYRPSGGIWYLLYSGQPGSYSAIPFGLETDTIAPADFDGDRKTDISIYRDGVWYIYLSQSNTYRIESWGLAGDTPMPGDYDGDGRADLAVYRQSDTTWYVLRSSDNGYQATAFGQAGDKAVSGDFDGDGRSDFALYRSNGAQRSWAVLKSGSGTSSVEPFGTSGDIAAAADFDGDGKTDKAIFRPSTGDWWWQGSIDNVQRALHWGATGDIPAAADYNGDGRADFTVFREGIWYIMHSNDSTIRYESWGLTTDKVIPAAFFAQ